MEDLQMKDINSVGLIVNVKTRINMFQQANLENIWSGELFDLLLKSIKIPTGETVYPVSTTYFPTILEKNQFNCQSYR